MKAETFRVSSSDRCSHRARRWRGAIARRGTASRGARRRGRDRRRSRPRHDVAVVLDDHLLRDWMASSDTALAKAINGDQVATTNLWYARLCKSAARASSGALLEGWAVEERRALIAGLVSLPEDVVVVPMRQLALRMGELSSDHHGLSALGAEAVAAAIDTQGRLLVFARDDGLAFVSAARPSASDTTPFHVDHHGHGGRCHTGDRGRRWLGETAAPRGMACGRC